MSSTMTSNRGGKGSWQDRRERSARRRGRAERLAAAGALLGAMLATSGAHAQFFSTVRAFSERDGSGPSAALVQGRDGILYGTTQLGGESGLGTVFGMTSTGALTMLHALTGSEGADLFGPLLLGRDGQLYGTTALGGPGDLDGKGVVFRLSPGGSYVALHFFSGTDGAHPETGLTQGWDGTLYGTTTSGGEGGQGTVFAISPRGGFRTLHSFSGSDGSMPLGELLVGHDGSLYGTTVSGGPDNGGTVFRISPSGELSLVHTFGFDPPDGNSPRGALTLGNDGCLYGTTEFGGEYGYGAVFYRAPSGLYTVLHSFSQHEGTNPLAGLIQARDGMFYGTTSSGGAQNLGTVFVMTPNGSVTVVHDFTGRADGGAPVSALLQARDGHLYGTTPLGGAGSVGTVYRIVLQRRPFHRLYPR
jgi:uncharacterized repeat protein (TIGR03803 family)